MIANGDRTTSILVQFFRSSTQETLITCTVCCVDGPAVVQACPVCGIPKRTVRVIHPTLLYPALHTEAITDIIWIG